MEHWKLIKVKNEAIQVLEQSVQSSRADKIRHFNELELLQYQTATPLFLLFCLHLSPPTVTAMLLRQAVQSKICL